MAKRETVFYNLFIVALVFLLCQSCKKQDEFLDAKSQEGDIVPTTLKEFQAVLDNTTQMNTGYITVGLSGTDNYYVPDASYAGMLYYEKNSYLWLKEIFDEVNGDGGYTQSYLAVRNSNIVLEGLDKVTLTTDNTDEYNTVKGHALFVRSMMFYNLVNTYAKQYNRLTASTDPGIPVRTFSDINIVIGRSSVQAVYNQMIGDLKTAAAALPISATVTTRPSKLAAYALLAKVYLQSEDYENAKKCCDSVLKYKSQLLPFTDNSIATSVTYRFPSFSKGNREILYYAEGQLGYSMSPATSLNLCYVDTILYNSYHDSDLRKTYFYNSNLGPKAAKFQGAYTGNRFSFCGLALNEVYFMRAECRVRLNDVAGGLDDMNTVLQNRYRANSYVNYSTTNNDTALTKILAERRKEFPFTGQIRWEDLKRLNNDSRFAKTLVRVYANQTYTLQPGSPRYVFPFTRKIIAMEGLEQNER